MIYEILNGRGALLAVLPNCGQSPQLAALRRTYDLSLQVAGPVALWRLAFSGNALEVCRMFRGELLPISED
jgi:hypothetical protein